MLVVEDIAKLLQRVFIVITLLGVALTPFQTVQAQVSAPEESCSVSDLWFSHAPVLEDDTVRIYVSIINPTDADITGTAEYFDGDELIGSQPFSSIHGQLIQTWTDWTATDGEHDITVALTNVVEHSLVGASAIENMPEGSSKTEPLFVDADNDGDGVGNQTDPDDDNDGLLDDEEPAYGTDPFNPDTDRDGATDGEEVNAGTDPLDSSSYPGNSSSNGDDNQDGSQNSPGGESGQGSGGTITPQSPVGGNGNSSNQTNAFQSILNNPFGQNIVNPFLSGEQKVYNLMLGMSQSLLENESGQTSSIPRASYGPIPGSFIGQITFLVKNPSSTIDQLPVDSIDQLPPTSAFSSFYQRTSSGLGWLIFLLLLLIILLLLHRMKRRLAYVQRRY